MALRGFPIDQLPTSIRPKAIEIIRNALTRDAKLVEQVDSVLRAHARSPFLEHGSVASWEVASP
jgi:citrate lyase beta subunit